MMKEEESIEKAAEKDEEDMKQKQEQVNNTFVDKIYYYITRIDISIW